MKGTTMNYRIFVKKKQAFQVESRYLEQKLHDVLGENLKVDIYNVYDVFNAEESDIESAKKGILAEIVTDNVYDDIDLEGKTYIAVEFLPGQYDQRADSAEQCLTPH